MRYSIAFRGKASMWVHLPSLSVSQDVIKNVSFVIRAMKKES